MSPVLDRIGSWFRSSAVDLRKASRDGKPPVVAYFWDGGGPVAHDVRDISPGGFYLSTSERWLVGTLIMMTLQRTNERARPDCSVIVMSKVIRHGEDGVGFTFMPVEAPAVGQHSGPGSNAADKRTLEKFLHLLASDTR
jgi:hypothetical protein